MPRLPDIESLGARPTPTPRSGVPVTDLPNNAGEVGLYTARVGQQIVRTGEELWRAAEVEKQRNDHVAAEGAWNDLEAWRVDHTIGQENGFTKYQGKDAVERPLFKEYSQKFEDRVRELASGLQNDEQRELFQRRASVSGRSLQTNLLSHLQRQQDIRSEEVFLTTKDTSVKSAAAQWRNDGERGLAMVRGLEAVKQRGIEKGWDKERLAAESQMFLTQLHEEVVNQAISADNVTWADEYLKRNGDSMDPQVRRKLQDKLNLVGDSVRAIGAVNEVWAKMGPRSDAEPASVDAMDAALREQYKDQPHLLKQARAELKDRATLFNAGQQEREYANEAAVWDAYDKGARRSAIMKLPEWQALPGGKRVQIERQMDAFSKSAKAEGEAAREDAMFEAYYRYSDPDMLSKMSEHEVMALYPVLGRRFTMDLRAKNRELTKPEKLKEATIDKQTFEQVAHDAGLRPYEPGLNEKQKARLGRLQRMIENAISVEQQRTGKNMSREQKEQLARSLTVEVQIREPGMLWGENIKPRRLFEVEGPEKIVVPEQDRADIILDFNRRGITRYTEQDILNAHLRKRAP